MPSMQNENSLPERILCGNGSESTSKHVDQWSYENHVNLDFSTPGTPKDNPYVETFNGKFRDECPTMNWIMDLDEAEDKIVEHRIENNSLRPHTPFLE
jgi:putative transposase